MVDHLHCSLNLTFDRPYQEGRSVVQFVEVFDRIHDVLAPSHPCHLRDDKWWFLVASHRLYWLLKSMMTILIVMIFGGSLSPSSLTQNLLPRDRWQQQLSHRLCGFLPLSHLRVTFCNLNWEEKTAPKLWTFNWSILWTLHAPKELIYSLQVVCLNVLPYFIPMSLFSTYFAFMSPLIFILLHHRFDLSVQIFQLPREKNSWKCYDIVWFLGQQIIRISFIIPLPVPNWASAEEQFIPNYPPQITIYSKCFFENPNFSLSFGNDGAHFFIRLRRVLLTEVIFGAQRKIWNKLWSEVDNLE